MSTLLEKIDRVEPEIREVWHDIHEHPEMGMELYRTADVIERELRAHTRYCTIHRVGPAGIWVELQGTRPGDEDNILMLRGDMDALPINEATGLPYSSKVPNVMHACGHDVHSSSLLGAVRVLEEYRDAFSGAIWFFFQPGEEILSGALSFLQDPAVDFSRVKAAAGCHVLGFSEVGKVNLRRGVHLASPDEISFVVRGKSAHASTPNLTVDAVTTAALLITQLQFMVSREVNPTDSVVLTLGRIEGGKKANWVADEVHIEGGLRTVNNGTRQRILERIQTICAGLGTATGAEITFQYVNRAPLLVNDNKMVDIAARAVERALGPTALEYADSYAMASEDFAFFAEKVPSVFMSIGCRTPGRTPVAAHTPQFYTDAGALRTAICAYVSFALEYFGVEF